MLTLAISRSMVALISAAVSVTDCLTWVMLSVSDLSLLRSACSHLRRRILPPEAFVCLSQTRIESLINRGDLIRDGFIHGGDLPVNISSDAFRRCINILVDLLRLVFGFLTQSFSGLLQFLLRIADTFLRSLMVRCVSSRQPYP
ncbi:hypothetical protein [Klebsiella pneumoniae]|uniref:hypothetical protein n=1 Tax=Klebsiella pneumoniae TaxID=573 RepID=UPI00396F434D